MHFNYYLLSSSSFQRRITTPTKALVNDMILNRRMSLTDKEALKDAKRSLSAMLEDFLLQHKRSLSESERKRIGIIYSLLN